MITKKIVLSLFIFASIVTISVFSKPSQSEAAVSFPYGCSSAIGYSVMTGSPCNGTSVATLPIPGCASPIGYSVMNGAICSGASEAISFLGGCTSVYGYSTATGAPCNGTAVASVYYDTTTPGLPTTGNTSMALVNILLLSSLGLFIVGSTIYATRQVKI